ncbi:rCG63547 [Rattus norvegicus]|uniref:RCG63547 n=1 Tax=Rattus norvegicus TaxID=10116 RepID=A6JCK6_RAT|nr:rCG63547 [Rattus norvegicus]
MLHLNLCLGPWMQEGQVKGRDVSSLLLQLWLLVVFPDPGAGSVLLSSHSQALRMMVLADLVGVKSHTITSFCVSLINCKNERESHLH